MDEKMYGTLGRMGALNISVGVVTIISGIVCGVLLIVAGSRLLASRKNILF